MNFKQAIQILDLKSPCNADEIKKAFRQLALCCHPDRNPNNLEAAARFREVAEAYTYLMEHTEEWINPLQAETQVKPVATRIENFDDIFDDIFSFTREDRILGFQPPQPVELNLIELAYGVNKRLKLAAFKKCVLCNGLGAEKNSSTSICTYCFGSGQIYSKTASENIEQICPKCEGRGRKIQKPCFSCNGFGRTRMVCSQELSIPSGLKSGGIYTLHSKELKTDKTCDVFIQIQLKSNPLFRLEGWDLYCEYPLSDRLAENGGNLDIPGIWGWVHADIPKNTKNGAEQSFSNHGLPIGPASNQRGKWIVTYCVVPHDKWEKEKDRFFKLMRRDNPLYDHRPFWKRILFR